jgi:hypothetical protein
MKLIEVYPTALRQELKYFWISFFCPMFGIINVLFLKIDFIHAIYEKLTENFKMFWKTIIFYDSMTANGNKLRNLKEKHETTDTWKDGKILRILTNLLFLILLRLEHKIIKWYSSSTRFLHNGQILLLISVLLCLPNSIISLLLLIFICINCFIKEEYDIVEVIVRGVNKMYNRKNELIDK